MSMHRGPLRIGISAVPMPDEPTGTNRYTVDLVRALAELECPHRFLLYAPPDVLHWFPARSGRLEYVETTPPRLIHRRLWEQLYFARRRPEVDVLFFPMSAGPLLCTASYVLTVYDLRAHVFPQQLRPRHRFYYRWLLHRGARRSAKVVVPSQATADQVVEHLGISREKIVVVGGGVNACVRRIEDTKFLQDCVRRYGLPERFILFVGALSRGKNIPQLVEAFSSVRSSFPDVYLVLAGSRGNAYDHIAETVRTRGLDSCVRFLGRVSDDDLPALYTLADVFAFPSVFEGFGLPVLEAMACGTPVVCSNAFSLPEVAGDAAILFDPHGIGHISDALKLVLSDTHLRSDLVERGYRRAAESSWPRVAEKMVRVFERSARGPS